jgi:NAD(P)-dependent dehydrogenase (short-subunit alcohol dehydrogenase family)
MLKGTRDGIRSLRRSRVVPGVNTLTVDLIRHLLPTMLAWRRGGLIVVTSAGAHYSTPNRAVYGGTKAFLLSFTEALATELQSTGVRAPALCPGPTSSEFGQVAGITKLLDGAPGLMTPDQVAAAGPPAWQKGRVVHVPGGMNQVMTATMSRIPRSANRWIVSAVFTHDRARLHAHAAETTVRLADISAFCHTRRQGFLSRAGPGFRRRCARPASRPDFRVC